jgi:aldose sugar dehydrogenase
LNIFIKAEMMNFNTTHKLALGILLVAFGAYVYYARLQSNVTPSGQPPTVPNEATRHVPDQEVLLENLTIPWDVVFLPTGELLITERTGNLILFDSTAQSTKSIPVPGVEHEGEGGLLGMALHPNFEENNFIYLYVTTSYSGGLRNAVYRYAYQKGMLTNEYAILRNIPGAAYHDGGRMMFGPDGMLYITTGDATQAELAQDKNSLAGKILRVYDDGSIPADNPYGNAIYSYGHRNPQGITWDAAGRLWSTEHGRSGVLSGLDELNLIIKGGNYGWPDSQGDTVLSGTIAPAQHSGADTTWAPASAVYWDGSIFFAGLRGETLYEAALEGKRVRALREHFTGAYGRLRTVILGPDGMLYLTTSNRDNRGDIRPGDDKLIRLNPTQFR